MYRLLTVACFLALFQYGQLASRFFVDEQLMADCRANNNEALSNDLLLGGEWFEIAKFTIFGGMVPSISCTNNVYTKAVAENLTAYQTVYDRPAPSMDDNPVLVSRDNGNFKGLLTGHTEAKDYFVEPGVFASEQTINNYKKLNDDYMLVWNCKLRGHTIWLHSRINHPTADEINAVIAGVAEVQRLEMQRFCATF